MLNLFREIHRYKKASLLRVSSEVSRELLKIIPLEEVER